MSLADSTACSPTDLACSTTPLATRDTLSATDRARFAILLAAFFTAVFRDAGRLREVVLREVVFRDDFFAEDFLADDFLADDFFAEDFRAADLDALFFRAGPLEADLRFIPRDADFREDDFRAGPLRPPDLRPDPLFLPVFEPPRDDFLATAIYRAPMLGFCCDTIATSAHKNQQRFASVARRSSRGRRRRRLKVLLKVIW